MTDQIQQYRRPTSLAPRNMAEAVDFASRIAKSSLVPTPYKGKPEDVLVAMQMGAELGLAPLQSLQNIAVINGKPSIYGDAALAVVMASGLCESFKEFFEGQEETDGFTAVCTVKRKWMPEATVRFSVADAKKANLWGKTGPWHNYPKRMLQMRARGFAIRDAFPDALKGLITAEEAQDYPPEQERAREKDVLPPPLGPNDPIDVRAQSPDYIPDTPERNAAIEEFTQKKTKLLECIISPSFKAKGWTIAKLEDLYGPSADWDEASCKQVGDALKFYKTKEDVAAFLKPTKPKASPAAMTPTELAEECKGLAMELAATDGGVGALAICGYPGDEGLEKLNTTQLHDLRSNLRRSLGK